MMYASRSHAPAESGAGTAAPRLKALIGFYFQQLLLLGNGVSCLVAVAAWLRKP